MTGLPAAIAVPAGAVPERCGGQPGSPAARRRGLRHQRDDFESGRFRQAEHQVEVLHGLAGSTLPRFNMLLQELTSTSRQLSELLDEIDSSPQMLILGRGRPQPGPGEAGFREPAR